MFTSWKKPAEYILLSDAKQKHNLTFASCHLYVFFTCFMKQVSAGSYVMRPVSKDDIHIMLRKGIRQFVGGYICLSVCRCVCLPVCMPVSLCDGRIFYGHLSVFLNVSLSTCLFVCLSYFYSVCLPFFLVVARYFLVVCLSL